MTTSRSEMEDGAAWARGLLRKPGPDVRTPDQRRADIRREVEAEVDAWMAEDRTRAERQRGAEQAAHVLRHAKAATAPRDKRPDEPIGTERAAPDGTVWQRKA